MKSALTLLFVFTVIVSSCTSKYEKQHEYENYCKVFFSQYKEGGINKAVDFIFSTNESLKENSREEIDALKSQLDSITPLLGKFSGYEQIANRAVGTNLRLLSYLIKYEKQPLRFTFVFYRPNDTWVIQNFSFDGNVVEELEESARVYLLNVYNEAH